MAQSVLLYALIVIVSGVVLYSEIRRRKAGVFRPCLYPGLSRWGQSDAHQIPAVSSAGIWQYYAGAARYILQAPEIIEEGCNRYPGRVFRVPRMFRWDYIVSGTALVDELASAPENVMSMVEGTQEELQTDLTLGSELFRNAFHVDAVRGALTRNLNKYFPDLYDELTCACEDVFALNATEWKLLPAQPSMKKLIARAINRIFVGLPACRNEDYLELMMKFAINTAIRAQVINLLPSFLQPLLGPFISTRKQSVRRSAKYLKDLINYRITQEETFGRDWSGKPNDFLSWLLELLPDYEKNVPTICGRILLTNMAALHSTASILTHALFDLTANPQHIASLREEVEKVVGELGWTREAINKMPRVDSFLRESQRMHDNGPVTMIRKVMDPAGFKFSDGTFLPFGSMIGVASRVEHFNPTRYNDPMIFDPFRFSRKFEERAARGDDKGEHFTEYMTSTSAEHLAFGHKQHACPGRFFVAAELKTLLAHLVMHYDIRAEIDGVRPPDFVFGLVVLPSLSGNIFLRKRIDYE
ncbi:cytochrome P450 [Mycena galopus ATCC 62051]|nr:cytochrome P450 [Mycena galopus ATCC 62051]